MKTFLKQRLQEFHDLVTDFRSGNLSSQIGSPQTQAVLLGAIKNSPDSLLDSGGGLVESQGVSEEHRSTEDGTDWVGNTLASDVGC